MKTAPRPYRRGVKLKFAPRPNRKRYPASVVARLIDIPPLQFTVQNFVRGLSITYTLTRNGYRYQVGTDTPVQTDEMSYPRAAALALRKYKLPAIVCQQDGGL